MSGYSITPAPEQFRIKFGVAECPDRLCVDVTQGPLDLDALRAALDGSGYDTCVICTPEQREQIPLSGDPEAFERREVLTAE